MKTSIARKLIFFFLITVITMHVLMSVTSAVLLRMKMQEELEKRAEHIATVLTESLTDVIWNMQYELAERIISAMIHDQNIDGISVEEMNGDPIAMVSNGGDSDPGGRIVVVKTIVGKAGGEPIGKLSITLNHKVMDKIFVQKMITMVCEIIAYVLLVTLVFTLFIRKYIVHPLRLLTSGIETLTAGGDFSKKIEFTSDDEFGFIAKQFNKMTSNLESGWAALERFNDRLTEIIRKKTEDLSAEKERAEAASKAKSEFLANMSHEIRTPMNAIIGITRMLLESDIPGMQRRHLETVHHAANGLLGILNDILDFSKIEARQLELEIYPFRLSKFLRNVCAPLKITAREKGIDLDYRIEPDMEDVFLGDELRLRQILLNLVSNSIKFTDQGRITIKVAMEKKAEKGEKNLIHFSVADTGIGIPLDQRENIFTSFSQADGSISRKFGGTGLGLAICRQLTEMMGGTIRVESSEGEGSTFHFTVALQSGTEEMLPEREQVEDDGYEYHRKLRILLVEDNRANQELVRMVMEKNGHSIRVAENGLQCLHALTRDRFDVILMDVQMPRMDGLTATRIIRAFEERKPVPETVREEFSASLSGRLIGGHIPIIAMTAHAMSGDREQCLAAGMDDYISKPFQPHILFSRLGKITGTVFSRRNTVVSGSVEKSAEADTDAADTGGGTPSLEERISSHLRDTYHLQPEQIDQMLTTTSRSLGENLKRAEKAAAACEYGNLGSVAHSIKGNLLSMGLQELGEVARKIELSAKNGEELSYGEMLEELRSSMQELLERTAAEEISLVSEAA